MTRTLSLSFLILASLLAGGCPDPGSPGDMSTPVIEAAANAGGQVEKDAEVMLTASVLEGDASVSFAWYQIFGRIVTLSSPTGREVSFAAPSVPREETLRFRVDARRGSSVVASSEVEVQIAADPLYGFDPSEDKPDEGDDDDDPFPLVKLETTLGDIVIELDREKAPASVRNFLRYVDDGFYDDTLWHRVIADFVVQGGGFDADLEQKSTRPPIVNEANNGLSNVRGTVAMARTSDPDSATAQFYINLVDNSESLDFTATSAGYAVFGKVVKGMDVADEIAAVETATRDGFSDVPVEDIFTERAVRMSRDELTESGGTPTP